MKTLRITGVGSFAHNKVSKWKERDSHSSLFDSKACRKLKIIIKLN
jgi:hypothetical protein